MGVMKDLALAVRGERRGGGDAGFARVKSLFFDRQSVRLLLDDGTRRALNHFGAYCMRVARNSIKSRDSVSSPGSPPHSHVGAENRRIRTALRKAGKAPPKLSRGLKEIYYSYDPAARSVVIGPIRFNSSQLAGTHIRSGNVTTPELLEYGGTAWRNVAPMQIRSLGKVWVHSPNLPPRRCTYRPRPFMGPAFEIARARLPSIWASSVRT